MISMVDKNPSVTLARRILFFYNFIYPLPGVPIAIWLLSSLTGSWAFALWAVATPFLYGYIVPYLGTNILHKWRFRGRWLWGWYFAHHGFIYASTMALGLWLCLIPYFDSATYSAVGSAVGSAAGSAAALSPFAVSNLSWPRSLALPFLCGALVGFVGWWHDLWAVRVGMIENYNAVGRAGGSPEETVSIYAPTSFFALGACYGSSALVAAAWLAEPLSASQLWLRLGALTLGAMLLLSTLPVLAYRRSELAAARRYPSAPPPPASRLPAHWARWFEVERTSASSDSPGSSDSKDLKPKSDITRR